MSNPDQTISPAVQRCANDIASQLAKLAKNPPDLGTYLNLHAQCLTQALKPSGFCYFFQSGSGFQPILHAKTEELNYQGMPEQENSFQRATQMAAEKITPVVIPARTMPSEGMYGLKVSDSPAPEMLPLFNHTAFDHIFTPIVFGQKVTGVLQMWFTPVDDAATQTRSQLMMMVCGEIELYLKARRISDISQELTRLTTYTHLLEELSGEMDLEVVSWNLVNYAREAVACERVCLFVAEEYGASWSKRNRMGDFEYRLGGCSGLKKPHPRSEQSETLKELAVCLCKTGRSGAPAASPATLASGAGTASKTLQDSVPVDSKDSADDEKKEAAPEKEAAPAEVSDVAKKAEEPPTPPAPQAAPPAPPGERPKFQMTLTQRDPNKTASRPSEVNDYFDLIPMNWATAMPLFDREQKVCGLLLFEGRKLPDQPQAAFAQMRDLATAGGHALGNSLYWHNRPSLRVARKVESALHRWVDTPLKARLLKTGVPVLAVGALMVMPVSNQIKGNATLRPTTYMAMPAMNAARVIEINTREGEHVKAGDVLVRLDTEDLDLHLRQINQDYEHYLGEADLALSNGNETNMQAARLVAQKSAAMAEKLKQDIAHSEIRAPFDGVVVGPQNLTLRKGEVPRVGETLVEVADPQHWEVKIDLREQDIVELDRALKLKPDGIAVSLKLAADPTKTIHLKLTSPSEIYHGLETTRNQYTFTVILPLDLPKSDGALLKLGFAGRASFDVGHESIARFMFGDFIHYLKVAFG